jgi:hypothetical protein
MTTVCSNCGEATEWDEAMGPAAFCLICWDLRCASLNGMLRRRRNLQRDREIRRMRQDGLTAASIGARFGIGKRAVFRALQRVEA